MAYQITYKNHITPQEYITENSRWYLDSDCGRKLTGSAIVTVSSRTYVSSLAVSATPSSSLTSGQDFIYIKNTSGGDGDDVLVSLDDGTNYFIVLSSGESLATKITASTSIKVKCDTDNSSTIEYLKGEYRDDGDWIRVTDVNWIDQNGANWNAWISTSDGGGHDATAEPGGGIS